MALLLGGSASPTGWSVQFVEAPFGAVLESLETWRRELGHTLRVSKGLRYPEDLVRLEPYQAPWTRELLFPCGTWTSYLNNGRGGGDSSASAVVVSRQLDVRHVMAENTPRYGPGHESTQLWLSGPEGDGPLRGIRSITAHATDGQWVWLLDGTAQPFEDVERYSRRRIRDRFDRALLVSYLASLQIPVDDPSAFGTGALIQQTVAYQVADFSRDDELRDVNPR